MSLKEIKQEITDREDINAIEMLLSTTCFCGELKRKKQSFCKTCFDKLPRQYQVFLYKKIGDGYEAAYKNAVKYLEESTI